MKRTEKMFVYSNALLSVAINSCWLHQEYQQLHLMRLVIAPRTTSWNKQFKFIGFIKGNGSSCPEALRFFTSVVIHLLTFALSPSCDVLHPYTQPKDISSVIEIYARLYTAIVRVVLLNGTALLHYCLMHANAASIFTTMKMLWILEQWVH